MKKKMVLKDWVQKVLGGLVATAVMLIVTTADSEWSKEYFIFLGICILVMVGGAYLLNKYGTMDDIDE